MGSIAIIIMAKAPQAGEVKTRLCPPLSPAEAAELYGCFLLDTIAKIRELSDGIPSGIRPVIAYTPTSRRGFFEAIAPDFTLIPQQGPDLGARMANCFAELLARGSRRVLLVGSDLPTLPVAYIQQAVACLTTPQVDVVLGPSEDGGYYLIGLHELHCTLFEDMPWSTKRVFARTRQRAEAKGLRVVCLPPWYDVDGPAELERLRQALAQMVGPTPYHTHTQRFFRRQAGCKETAS